MNEKQVKLHLEAVKSLEKSITKMGQLIGSFKDPDERDIRVRMSMVSCLEHLNRARINIASSAKLDSMSNDYEVYLENEKEEEK